MGVLIAILFGGGAVIAVTLFLNKNKIMQFTFIVALFVTGLIFYDEKDDWSMIYYVPLFFLSAVSLMVAVFEIFRNKRENKKKTIQTKKNKIKKQL